MEEGIITILSNLTGIEAKASTIIHKIRLDLKHIRDIKVYLQEDKQVQFHQREEDSWKSNEKRGNNLKIILNVACKKSVQMQLIIY